MIEEYNIVAYSMFCDQCGRELSYTSEDKDDMEKYARVVDWLIEEDAKGDRLHFCCHKCRHEYQMAQKNKKKEDL